MTNIPLTRPGRWLFVGTAGTNWTCVVVRIGNSRGIRIPKTLLDEADLPEEVELHAQPGRLVVQAARRPRSGWAAAAKRMQARGDDRVLDESTPTKFDREEWEWR